MFKAPHTLNCATFITQYTIIPPFDHMGTVGSGGDIVAIYTPKTPMIARFFVHFSRFRLTEYRQQNALTPSYQQHVRIVTVGAKCRVVGQNPTLHKDSIKLGGQLVGYPLSPRGGLTVRAYLPIRAGEYRRT